jgi:hypothetical protein
MLDITYLLNTKNVGGSTRLLSRNLGRVLQAQKYLKITRLSIYMSLAINLNGSVPNQWYGWHWAPMYLGNRGKGQSQVPLCQYCIGIKNF